MSGVSDYTFDPDLIQLILRAESSWREVDEMSSSIGEEAEAALAGVAEEITPICCQFAEKITAENREGLAELLEIAVSEEFRKSSFIISLPAGMS